MELSLRFLYKVNIKTRVICLCYNTTESLRGPWQLGCVMWREQNSILIIEKFNPSTHNNNITIIFQRNPIVYLYGATYNWRRLHVTDCALWGQAFKWVAHIKKKHSSPRFKTPRLTWISAKTQATGQTPRCCFSSSLSSPFSPFPSHSLSGSG